MSTSDPATSLAAATWRRDFRMDSPVRQRTQLLRMQLLPEELKDAVVAAKAELHPSQTIEVDRNKPSVTLYDGRRELLIGLISAGEPGELQLQIFSGRGKEIYRAMLQLDRYGEDEYVWTDAQMAIPADKLAEYIVRVLVEQALDVIHGETPKLNSADRFIS